MSSGRRCKNCGSSDIEVDPARGDAVCTNCGSVLEDSIIVSEVQFEENARGASSAIGQFVSVDSKGGGTSFGSSFHVGTGLESRELTMRYSRAGISNLCSQLRLNQHCIDTACNFYRMALTRNLTRGRRHAHVYAACVYLTCRTEGTSHMLIDISEVLQICCYELGRTYLKLSQALCINIPAVDPCLYILRFAAKLEFGSKTQEVANTALRLVQRMKRDSIHSGRRPSGLCGAALLMASRLHEFNRTVSDIVKIVKVHESTLKKRLIEFGDTPSSSLTLEEFMTVDLEEEQDPPSYKAARKKDKERLQKLFEEEGENLTELQTQIETYLEKTSKTKKRKRKASKEETTTNYDENEADRFVQEEILGTISDIIKDVNVDDPSTEDGEVQLGPNIASMGLAKSIDDERQIPTNTFTEVEVTLDDVDDEELDAYIMSEDEVQNKNNLWYRLNATYLAEQKLKQEKLQKEKEEGKPEKKKKRAYRKRNQPTSASEAIEKILQEKKVSSKINYDVLKTLNAMKNDSKNVKTEMEQDKSSEEPKREVSMPVKEPSKTESPPKRAKPLVNIKERKPRKKEIMGLPVYENDETTKQEIKPKTINEQDKNDAIEDETLEDFEEEPVQAKAEEVGMLDMLRQHQIGQRDEDEHIFGYDYEEDEY